MVAAGGSKYGEGGSVLVASGGSEFGGSGRVGVVSADAGGLGASGGVLIRTGESMDKQ